jgi:hypothetical protein
MGQQGILTPDEEKRESGRLRSFNPAYGGEREAVKPRKSSLGQEREAVLPSLRPALHPKKGGQGTKNLVRPS